MPCSVSDVVNNTTTNDHDNEQDHDEDIPRTPPSGQDSPTSQAFSYADAAAENTESTYISDDTTTKRLISEAPILGGQIGNVPTTPLGGHDPTGPNAFSYAQAAQE
jgi:hypothetical protein